MTATQKGRAPGKPEADREKERDREERDREERDREERDRVDRAGEDSFPASDPPSWTAGHDGHNAPVNPAPEPPGKSRHRR